MFEARDAATISLHRSFAITFLLVVGAFTVSGQDQKNQSTDQRPCPASHPSGATSNGPTGQCNGTASSFEQDMQLFTGDLWARFGRSFEYDFQRVEQPRVFQTSSGTTVPNPEEYLNEHTLTFQFSELFPSSATRFSAFKSAYTFEAATPGATPASVAADFNRPFHLNEIAAAGGWLKRTLSGVTVAMDLSERPALQQGVIVTNTSFSDHYQVTGSFAFDPSQLFISGTNWKILAKDPKTGLGFSGYPCEFNPKDSRTNAAQADPVMNRPPTRDCIDNLAAPRFRSNRGTALKPSRGIRFLAAVVPTFAFKKVSQFDFLKAGGVLVPSSFLDSSQNQFVFHWDLKRAIASSTSRTDALSAFPDTAPVQPQRVCEVIYGSNRNFIPVSDKFTPEACRSFADRNGASDYALDCLVENSPPPQMYDPKKTAAKVPSCWITPK